MGSSSLREGRWGGGGAKNIRRDPGESSLSTEVVVKYLTLANDPMHRANAQAWWKNHCGGGG